MEFAPGKIIRGKYKILRKIDAGGMGVVYEARHLVFGEKRAIKVLFGAGMQGMPGPEELKREAQVLWRLDHPHIARVVDFETTDEGQPYLALEYVDGESLHQRLKAGVLAPELALRFAAQTCAALSFAHQEGILHRDVKPKNLLLAKAADGSEMVKVIDFGIAKVREEAGLGFTSIMNTNEWRVGTAAYASPEQLSGTRGKDLDERTDLYSLGLVLYEMLTGILPFAQTPEARSEVRPAPPDRVRPDLHIHSAISDLVMKAIETDREKRYRSAEEMERAIEAVLEEVRVERRQPDHRDGGPPKPPALPHQDYLAAAAVLLAILGLAAQVLRLAGLFGAPSWLVVSCCATAMLAGGSRWRKGAGPGKPIAGVGGCVGALVLASTLSFAPNPGSYTKLAPLHVPEDSTEPVTCLALSPDGRFVARGSSDRSVQVWEVSSGRSLWKNTKHDETVRALAFSPDGRTLASGGDDVQLNIWDARTGELLRSPRERDATLSLAFSPDGRYVAVGSKDATICLRDVRSGQLSKTLPGHDGPVLALAFSPDGGNGGILVSGGQDPKVLAWDRSSWEPRAPPLRGFTGKVVSLAASAGGRMVAAGSDAGSVALWDAGSPSPRPDPWNLGAEVRSLVFASGHLLAAAGQDGVLSFIDVQTRRVKPITPGMAGKAEAVALSANGSTLALGFRNGTLKLFRCE